MAKIPLALGPLTVGEVITRLQACNPAAYLCLDDGLALPVVDISTCSNSGHRYYAPLGDKGGAVEVAYVIMRGDYERHDQMVDAMKDQLLLMQAITQWASAIEASLTTGMDGGIDDHGVGDHGVGDNNGNG